MKTIDVKKIHSNDDIEKILSKNMEKKCIDIEIEYVSDFKNTKILRSFIEIFCDKLWFDKREASKLVLVVDELNNNAIEYGSENWWINKLRIKCEKKIKNITIEVEDTWKWKKSKKVLDMETLRAHRLKKWYREHNSIRWRWLFLIIIKAVDRLYFKNSDKWWLIVWIKKLYK